MSVWVCVLEHLYLSFFKEMKSREEVRERGYLKHTHTNTNTHILCRLIVYPSQKILFIALSISLLVSLFLSLSLSIYLSLSLPLSLCLTLSLYLSH